MQPAPEHMTQADFARHMGVSRAAVSQWRKRDILRDDAFTLPGKKGKVIVAVAVEQVRLHRDIGQSLGNGIETRTSTDAANDVAGSNGAAAVVQTIIQPDLLDEVSTPVPVELPAKTPETPKAPSVEDLLKHAKLEEQLRRNRTQGSEEALQQGKLMSAEDAREQMARVAGMMLQIFEGALTDFAAVIASQFKAPQRDVLHLLKSEFRNVRHTATQKEKARVASLEKGKTVTVKLDE